MTDYFAVTVPMENVNDEFAAIVKWNILSGSEVKKGDIIVTLETMKAIFEIEAEEEGFLFYEINEGSEIKIGSEIAYICKENKRPFIKPRKADAVTTKKKDGKTNFSAKAEKLMKEYKLNSEDFSDFEKVKLEDVKAMIAKKGLMKKFQRDEGGKSKDLPQFESVKISSAKKYEIQQLSQSSRRVIPSSVSIMVDADKAEDKATNMSKTEGVKPTIVELIIYQIAKLLKKYNLLNGFYDDGHCVVYSDINIGFAVNIGKGLKVPVIKNADKMSLKEISNSVKDLSLKYFREELRLDDISGGTFTVTDLSTKGVIDFYPVINNMQSAILGVCSIMPGTNSFKIILTFDHNMADGMIAADILKELSNFLQGNNAV